MKNLFLLVILFSFLNLCFAEPDFSKGVLDRQKVVESAASVDRIKYPDADDILLESYEFISYKKDGTYSGWEDTFLKVLTEKGRREDRTQSQHFDCVYERVEYKLIEIIKPDGKVVPIDIEKQSQVMVDSGQMGANIYDPNSKVMRVNIPGLEVGDILRVVECYDVFKTRVPDTWSGMFSFEHTSPIKHYSLEVSAPKELPLLYKELKDPIEGTVETGSEEKNGRIIYKWSLKDVPQVFPEPEMPPLYSVVQRLLLSTIKDWQSVSRWYWKLCVPHLDAVTPEMKDKVKELTNGLQDKQKMMEAIFYFVSQKVRYMGITTETESPGYEPHDVKITFENKYGVCRDKAALLAAMLRLAGFKAYPVLIMTGPKKDEEVPNPYFNHAVVGVENDDNSYTLMDPTDETTKDIFPSYLCNKSYLVAKPEGDKLRTSPIIPADKNMLKISTKASLSDSAILSAESVITFDGINDSAYRGSLANKKTEEKRRFFEKIVKSVYPDASLLDLTLTPEDMNDTSQPLKAVIKYISGTSLIKGKNKLLMTLPSYGNSVGIVNFIIGQTGLEKRKYPMDTEIACGIEENISIDLADFRFGKAELPDYEQINNNELEWAQNIGLKDKQLDVSNKFLIKTVEFTPSQYLQFKETLKKIEFNRRKKTIFDIEIPLLAEGSEKNESDANILILDQNTKYEILNSGFLKTSVKFKGKIMTYAGKKRFSELKFNYNPIWNEIKLESAKVTLPDGTEKKISEKEINIMDQPWVGAAPRYPAGKTLVANLPGVDVGSIIEYEYSAVSKDLPFVSIIDYFQSFDPIIHKKVNLKKPENLPLKVTNHISQASTDDSEKKGEWKVKNVQGIRSEENMPPLWTFLPYVAISTGNWKSYCGEIKSFLEKACSEQKKTADKAREIKENLKTDANRAAIIKAVRDFVALNIKNAGPNFIELPMSCITPSDKTLEDGYGNSIDRAVLIYTLLKSLGIDCEFVLATGLPYLDSITNMIKENPQMFFDDVLVRTKDDNFYLNDTDQYSELGATSHSGRLALFPDSVDFKEIEPPAPYDDKIETTYLIDLSENESAEIKKTLKYYGMSFAGANKKFAEMTPEDRRRYYLEIVAQISQSAKAKGELVSNFKEIPGIEEFTVDVAKFAVCDGKYLYFYLPESLAGLLQISSDKRENPYYIGSKICAVKDYYIRIPEKYSKGVDILPEKEILCIPSEKSKTTSYINITSSILPSDSKNKNVFFPTEKKGEIIHIRHEISIHPSIISGYQYDDLISIKNRISNLSTRTILLEKE